MCFSAVVLTIFAWVVGAFIDAALAEGFFTFRILFPILVMGVCILKEINRKKPE